MSHLKIDISHISKFVELSEIKASKDDLQKALSFLKNKNGPGNNYLGWVNLPIEQDSAIIDNILKDVEGLAKDIDVFVVIGIGGSYLGARAVIEALDDFMMCCQSDEKRPYPQIIYAGHNLCQDYLFRLLKVLDNKSYAVGVISKSGTTTEPAVAFRMIKQHMIKKYGVKKSKNRIIAITDKAKGALKSMADTEGYTSYVIPDDVGGRYSVLTPVGLFPMAMAGVDIRALISGAKDLAKHLAETDDIFKNPAALYAICRNILYRKGKQVEILAAYQPALYYFIEWWKQLFGESEGKDNKGIFPAGVTFTTDLHSMGQYIQEGVRNIFETTLHIENPKHNLELPKENEDLDGLNYLVRRQIDFINKMAEKATIMAHVSGGVPNLSVVVPRLNAYYLGQLIYFFEYSCALSGYMLGVNPFDQPGVEAYKKNMFKLLGKPGV